MNLDIRWPIGLIFLVVGVMLAVYGAATQGDPAQYARSLGVNINLLWGAVLTLFGGVLAGFAARAMRRGQKGN